MPRENYVTTARASFPYRLTADASTIDAVRSGAEELAARSQYGWGHTIDFGPFVQRGLLGDKYLQIAGLLDAWEWWPRDLRGRRVADIGCFTGGLSLVMAARAAEVVYAVDEVAEHLAQCRFVVDAFDVRNVEPVEDSAYRLENHIQPGSLDLIVLAGVLYHLSDMLVGLMECQRLLAPGGTLIVESNAVECFEHSYANFGRYFEGMWWQPTARCLEDLATYSGLQPDGTRFYKPGRVLARMTRPEGAGDVPFKRGVNLPFSDVSDAFVRTRDVGVMRPAPDFHAQAGLLRRAVGGAAEHAYRRLLSSGYGLARRVRRH